MESHSRRSARIAPVTPDGANPPLENISVRSSNVRGRGRGRGMGTLEPEASIHESSTSGRGRGRGRAQNPEYVTREHFDAEIGKLKAAIQSLLEHHHNTKTENKENPQPSKGTEGCDYKMFLACEPPTYSGDRDPLKAMRWLREIEAIYDAIKCSSEDRVIFAVSILKSDALIWWDIVMFSKGSDIAKGMSWEDFKIEFKDHFCPKMAMRELEEEFLRLKQDNTTVQEYTSRFLELSRFAELYVSTEAHLVNRYVWGLEHSIRECLIVSRPTTFQSAVDSAEAIEKVNNEQLDESDGEERKWDEPSNDMRRPKFARFDNRRNQRFG